MCAVKLSIKRVTITVSLVFLLVIGYFFARMVPFFLIASGTVGGDLTNCKNRVQVRAVLKEFKERQLAAGEQPVWSFLHPMQKTMPKEIVNYEYRLYGMPGKFSAICVAYDKKDRLVGLYEYD